MSRLKSLLLSLAGAAVVSLWTPVAMADAVADRGDEESAVAAAQPDVRSPFGGAVLNTDALDAQRGGSDLFVNEALLDTKVSDNTVANVATGHNYVGEGSFANSHFMGAVIQNTGNANSFQSSTNVIVIVQ